MSAAIRGFLANMDPVHLESLESRDRFEPSMPLSSSMTSTCAEFGKTEHYANLRYPRIGQASGGGGSASIGFEDEEAEEGFLRGPGAPSKA